VNFYAESNITEAKQALSEVS